MAHLAHHAAALRDELHQPPRAAQCGGRPIGQRGPLGAVAQQRGEVCLVRAAAEADLTGGACGVHAGWCMRVVQERRLGDGWVHERWCTGGARGVLQMPL